MLDLAPMRLACPACLGVALEKVSVAPGVDIDHCRAVRRHLDSCASRRRRLRAEPADALRATLTRANDAPFLCHSCHAPMGRDAASACGASGTTRWSARSAARRCAGRPSGT